MLRSLIASTEVGKIVIPWIDVASLAIEVLAVLIIIVGIVAATITYIYHRFQLKSFATESYENYRHSLARTLLLGLEILVAADVVRTVALEATLQSVLVLGMLVVIRTFLSWSLTVEVEGRWPWHKKQV